MLRRGLIFGAVLVSIAIVLGPVVFAEFLPCGRSIPDDSWIDLMGKGIIGLVVLLDEDHTSYAPGYGEAAFRSLRIGVSQEEALAALGPPLGKRSLEEGQSAWYYSTPGEKIQHYLIRVLIFGPDGRLSQRQSGCYMD